MAIQHRYKMPNYGVVPLSPMVDYEELFYCTLKKGVFKLVYGSDL